MVENNLFVSVWTQNSPYWLVIEGGAGPLPGFTPAHDKTTLCARKVEADWSDAWLHTAQVLNALSPTGAGYRAAVLPSESLPTLAQITGGLRSVREINTIANHVWLLNDLRHGQLGCHLQRVVDRRGKQVGFEAFARMESHDGGVIGGGAIMQAAEALQVQYVLDQLLHKKAVESFVARDLEGVLFINFLTGFTQTPDLYLEGLNEAVTAANLRPNAIALDVTLKDYGRDLHKLAAIGDYCRRRGFALALDDVMSAEELAPLLDQVRPAFVKLDGKFGEGMKDSKRAAALEEVIALAHGNGASVLAEGVESQAAYDAYFAAGVDMFQGYFIGAPEGQVPVRAGLKLVDKK